MYDCVSIISLLQLFIQNTPLYSICHPFMSRTFCYFVYFLFILIVKRKNDNSGYDNEKQNDRRKKKKKARIEEWMRVIRMNI